MPVLLSTSKNKRKHSEPELTWWHQPEDQWYQATIDHWSTAVQADTDDGVLGGYGGINDIDAASSIAFLKKTLGGDSDGQPAKLRALDVGAGIGRVAANVLLPVCDEVDVVEVSESLLSKARDNLANFGNRVGFVRASLRDFTPDTERGGYDVIWMQWVLGHLTDSAVLQLLCRCHAALRKGGAVVIKDNNSEPRLCKEFRGKYILDPENASVIRTHRHHLALFRAAGFKVSRFDRQLGFPKELYTVRTYELRPMKDV